MKKIFAITLGLALAALAVCSVSCCRKDAPKQRAKHVVMIGIDGWAAEAVRLAPAADLPNIHYLMDHGAWTLSKRFCTCKSWAASNDSCAVSTSRSVFVPFIINSEVAS